METEELFGLARRFVPEALLDGPGWERVLDRVGDGLPGSALVSNVLGFEFRLWDDEPSADFGPTLSASTPLVDFLVDRGRAAASGSREAALGAFLSRLSGEGWPANGALEYDVVGVPSGEQPHPGLFMNIGPYPENAGAPPPAEVVGIIADALCLPRDDDEHEAVQRVCEALPPGAFVYHVGTMPSRARRAVRVAVEGVEADGVPGFLSRIGWPGPIPLVADTLADMLARSARFALALDVSPPGPAAAHRLGDKPAARRADLLRRMAGLGEKRLAAADGAPGGTGDCACRTRPRPCSSSAAWTGSWAPPACSTCIGPSSAPRSSSATSACRPRPTSACLCSRRPDHRARPAGSAER